MITMEGIAIKAGLCIGTARKISPKNWQIERKQISQAEIAEELYTLETAIADVHAKIALYLDSFQGSAEDKEILRTQQVILSDPELSDQLHTAISQRLESAAWAVQSTFSDILMQFKAIQNDFFSQRAADYKDVEQHLLTTLLDYTPETHPDWLPSQIAILSEITPSLVSSFAHNNVSAYCAEHGAFTSHASILTRSLGITALAALPDLFAQVQDGDELILDGIEGRLIINPDASTRLLYRDLQLKYQEQDLLLRENSQLPTQTLAGRRIRLSCNLELLDGFEQLRELGADGIGLYRTEFLYLGKHSLPGEDLQFEVYRQVAQKTAPQSVVIRSFDLGGDKLSHLIPAPQEDNPYLGCRGIRFSLANPKLLRTQIRAVLRASRYGRIKLMFPMVFDLRDFLAAKEIVLQCRQELDSEGISYDHALPLGVMIEIPSAALCADELAQHCDFFSIGTNDLVQYTLAADRNNSALSDYYISHHPAVLQLLAKTLAAAQKEGIPVSICGEMASLPEYIPLLVGMGFTELSVNPASFYQCKSIIRRCDAALDELMRKFDLTCSLHQAQELIEQTLKPYYQI